MFFLLNLNLNLATLSPLSALQPLRFQADAAALTRLYDSMARDTETLGLDAESIRSMWSFYHPVTEEEEEKEEEEANPRRRRRKTKPAAKRYSEFSPPLAPAAIRLLLFFLDGEESDSDPGVLPLRAAGDAAVEAVLAELEAIDRERESAEGENPIKNENDESPFPSLASAFHVTPGRHMTVFQASHPASIVPDSTSSEVDDDGEEKEEEAKVEKDDGAPPLLLGAPPAGALEREIAAARATALAVGSPPRLVPHRVFLARSGALLLTLTEEAAATEAAGGEDGNTKQTGSGRVAALRREASVRMPRASRRQPAILHITLGRLLSSLPTASAAARVSRAAEEAARPFLAEAREKKKVWIPALSHVIEDTFASVDGRSVLLPFS